MTRVLSVSLSAVLVCSMHLATELHAAISTDPAAVTSSEDKKVRVFFRKGKKEQDGPIPPGVMKLQDFDLHNRKNLQLLTDKINEALSKVERQEYSLALQQLETEVLRRTDGCARDGEPDSDDLITDCRAQKEVYPLVMESIIMIKAIK